jgi:sulfide:quinone oxidoreductase
VTGARAARVVIAGGGFAAVEALLALRALAGDRVELQLVAPEPVLAYRPAATAEPFAGEAPLRYDLGRIADDVGARYVRDAVAAVAPRTRTVRTTSHARLAYDFLVLALGARSEASIPGATTFRDQRDAGAMRRVMVELWAGDVRRLAFAVPAGSTWPLPVYELALQAGHEAHEEQLDAEIALVTPEAAPLEAFGPSASRLVAELLRERGVRFVGGAAPASFDRDGRLTLASGDRLAADRVIAAPRLVGPRVSGVPSSWTGFTPVDSRGRVHGLDGVYAAGDMTSFPVKQGGVAAQQADDVAGDIAAMVGAPVRAHRGRRELRARLLGGERPLILRAELDAEGRPGRASWIELPEGMAAEPASKVAARYLTPYLERRPALAVA